MGLQPYMHEGCSAHHSLLPMPFCSFSVWLPACHQQEGHSCHALCLHDKERSAPCCLALQGLAQYGNGFLAKFEAASCPNRLLEEITLVDTPGVLSGKPSLQPHCLQFALQPLLLLWSSAYLLHSLGASAALCSALPFVSPAVGILCHQSVTAARDATHLLHG